MALWTAEAYSISNPKNSMDTDKSTFSLELEDGHSPSSLRTGPKRKPSGASHVRVSRFRAEESEKAMPTNDTSGPLFTSTSPSADLQRSLENRLRARTDLNGSLEYELTWKEQDMPAGVPLCRLQAKPRTGGKGFSSWQTPTVDDANNLTLASGTFQSLTRMALMAWATPRAEDAESAGMRHGRGVADTLSAQAGQDLPLAAWPTASARDWKDSEGMSETGTNPDGSERTRHDQLPRVAQLVIAPWHTPDTAPDAPNKGSNCKNVIAGLGNQALAAIGPWATPKTSDANGIRQEDGKRCVGLNTQASGAITTSSPAETEKRGALNPNHSRWLMGYPIYWTLCGMLAYLRMRPRRHSARSRSLNTP